MIIFLTLFMVACGSGGWGPEPPPGVAPIITSVDNTVFTIGTAGTFTVTATGDPASTFALSGTLPSGVTFDTTTGVLSGTPAAGSSGVYTLTITASNGISPAATQNFTLTVVSDLIVTSQGINLVVYGVKADGTVIELSNAALPSAGLLAEHAIFGITKHPTRKWLYTGSLNVCSSGDNACWGNARIDRFSYDASGALTYEGIAFNFTPGSGPACADEDASDYPGQSGNCAPTTTAISSDGSRLYVDCDDLDGVQIFAVNPVTGNLSFLWEGSETSYNGLAVSPDDGYLYNGSRVITLSGDTASYPVGGNNGNATEIVTTTGSVDLMVTTLNNDTLTIFDLVDQSAPAQIATLTLADAPVVNYVSNNPAVFQHSSADLSTFVVVGAESVATVRFDGASLTLLDQVFDTDDTLDVMNRGVAVTRDGKYALVTSFMPYDAAGDPLLTGSLGVYRIATDGKLTLLNSKALDVPARMALRLP